MPINKEPGHGAVVQTTTHEVGHQQEIPEAVRREAERRLLIVTERLASILGERVVQRLSRLELEASLELGEKPKRF